MYFLHLHVDEIGLFRVRFVDRGAHGLGFLLIVEVFGVYQGNQPDWRQVADDWQQQDHDHVIVEGVKRGERAPADYLAGQHTNQVSEVKEG